MIGNLDEATGAYEHALRANPRSIAAMNAISAILRTQEHFHKAVEYLNKILALEPNNGDVWGSLGKCRISYIDNTRRSYMNRTLLFDDGRSPASLLCLSAGSISSSRSQGLFYTDS